jgi:hypothetical protein
MGRGGPPAERTFPVAHMATFPLPESRGDFGQGAVELMGPDDALVVLFEYGPESAGTELFSSVGLPRRLSLRRFGPSQLQRTIPGQLGHQRFFTASGRPFSLYVVLGSGTKAGDLLATVNGLLGRVRIDPA